MIYSKIGTVLCGHLKTEEDVTIKLINAQNDELIPLQNNICNKSKHSDIYYFNTNLIDEEYLNDHISQELEIVYEMSDDYNTTGGKIVISQDNSKLKELIIDIGKLGDIWELIPENQQLTYRELIIKIKQNSDLVVA